MAGVELRIDHGPRSSYALLGGEIEGGRADVLQVVVSLADAGRPFPGSLALAPDDVRVGLPDEYATAVLAGVAHVAELTGVPTAATLRFRCAAHALVGSSPAAFQRASELVLRLLAAPRAITEAELRAVVG